MTDYTRAELPGRTRALLDFCVRATKEATKIRRRDLDALRALGWSDEAIHDAVQVTGFFNYYVRLADALGVEPEDFMRAAAEEWARSHAT